jgi:hypothetical protein
MEIFLPGQYVLRGLLSTKANSTVRRIRMKASAASNRRKRLNRLLGALAVVIAHTGV